MKIRKYVRGYGSLEIFQRTLVLLAYPDLLTSSVNTGLKIMIKAVTKELWHQLLYLI